MPAPDAIIIHGDIEESTLVDEPNLLVQSMTYSATRERRDYKGGEGYIKGLQYRNPLLAIACRAYVSNQADLADGHPGEEVTELANFESSIHGFDPTVGILVMEDPTTERTVDDADQVSFTVMHFPFISG
jgi:hypothetical protein